MIAAVIAIAAGIVTISSRNPVKSALSLVVQFFMLAAIYLTLNAQFVAVIQILVYAGAIMVLVVFVIMLLNLGDDQKLKEKISFRIYLSVFLAGLLLVLFASQYSFNASFITTMNQASVRQGTVEAIGQELFTNYLIPFEATGLLLLMAIIGAVILAKRKLD